jgi:septum formation protein
MSGKVHYLVSSVAVVNGGETIFECTDVATMKMRSLSDEFIDSYLGIIGSAALSSVGAYQIEGLGIQLFEKIKGAYSTILGLPLEPTLGFFRRSGALAS